MAHPGLLANHERSERVLHWLRAHVTVRAVVPLVLALGLLAYVSDLASAPHSGAELWTLIQRTWWTVFVLTVPYLATRAIVWWELLDQLDVRVRIRPFLVSFAGGEITKSLPAGDYVQNYLLSRFCRFDAPAVVRSFMATTAILALESALAVPAVLIIGVPGWNWLFWTIIGLIAAWILLLIILWLLVDRWGSHVRAEIHPLLRRVRDLVEEFLQSGGALLTRRTLRSLLPTAVYMLCYVVDLYVMIRAVEVHGISFVDTLSIYGFTVLVTILIPIPGEIGVTELSGLGVLMAYGVPAAKAAVIVLGLRILATGFTIVQSGAILAALRKEFKAVDVPHTVEAIASTESPR
jgi:uncharacterized membrane protein YbhN (UPF0104 family)